jgi:hypothetical protein
MPAAKLTENLSQVLDLTIYLQNWIRIQTDLVIGQYLLNQIFTVGESPSDDYGRSDDDLSCEWFESDLRVARLLVERVKAEEWNHDDLVAGLLMSTCWDSPAIPPALEYLFKQETLDFSLYPPIGDDYSKLKHNLSTVDIADWNWPIASTLRIFLESGVDISAFSTKEQSVLFVRILQYFNISFEDPESQKEAFNAAVLEFTTLLRYGFNTSTPLLDSDPDITVSWIVTIDPHFTEVAWKLALELTG